MTDDDTGPWSAMALGFAAREKEARRRRARERLRENLARMPPPAPSPRPLTMGRVVRTVPVAGGRVEIETITGRRFSLPHVSMIHGERR